jgi:hypothetical protein
MAVTSHRENFQGIDRKIINAEILILSAVSYTMSKSAYGAERFIKLDTFEHDPAFVM